MPTKTARQSIEDTVALTVTTIEKGMAAARSVEQQQNQSTLPPHSHILILPWEFHHAKLLSQR